MDLSYPLEMLNGRLVLCTSRIAQVGNAIRSALLTQKTERVMRPRYGIATKSFDALDLGAIAADLKGAVNLALADFPEANYALTVRQLDGLILADVTYTIDQQTLALALSYAPSY